MTRDSQLLTKNGRPVINRITKMPIYTKPVDLRLKNIRKQLNDGLSKSDSVWNNIIRDTRTLVAA